MDKNNKVVAIVGPTGSGKTALAVELAKKFDGVIISADSRQVYSGLDIGTNKEGEPGSWGGEPARIIDGIPQLLVDVAKPGERFTLHDWLEKTKYVLKPIWALDILPIIAGGTGLYVTALLEGYQLGKGRYSQDKRPNQLEALIIMPKVEREDLYRRSDARYPKIFNQLVRETKSLIEAGVSPEWLERIGLDYRYATYYILGKRNRELAIEEFQTAGRAYIRRQITWWRHHGEVQPVADADEASQKIELFLRKDGK